MLYAVWAKMFFFLCFRNCFEAVSENAAPENSGSKLKYFEILTVVI